MTCGQATDRLDDYVDALLLESEAAAVAEHLSACSACSRSEASLRRLLRAANDLPREAVPPPELWDGIADRIEKDRKQTFTGPRRPRVIRLEFAALAAALLLIVAAAGTGLGFWLARNTPKDVSVRADAAPSCEQALLECVQARNVLLRDLEERRNDLSPETLKTVRDNLRVIDEAITDIRHALEGDPENLRLQRMLVTTYEKEVGFLAQIVRLADRA